MSDIKSFVTTVMGAEAAAKLGFIRTGGDNNRKGNAFECFVAVAKICEFAISNTDLTDTIVTSQDEAFVDDLCICQPKKSMKHNYQIKNSSGPAGAWTSDMEWRFQAQQRIDQEYHKIQNSCQTLLVACSNRANLNNEAIPQLLKTFCSSEYLLSSKKSTEFLLLNPRVSNHLAILCSSDRKDIVDAAFRCLAGVMATDDSSRTVKDVLNDAQKIARPDLFRGLALNDVVVPEELRLLCDRFQNLSVRVECGRIFVSYNGMSATISPDSALPESLLRVQNVFEVMMLLMQVATSEIQDS